MSEEQNKVIFRRYVEEVGNEGNLDLADEIFDRYLAHQSDGSVLERGPEDVKRFMGEFQDGFPDFHSTIEDMVAEGDKVVTRWRMRGTHRLGNLPGHKGVVGDDERAGGWGNRECGIAGSPRATRSWRLHSCLRKGPGQSS